MDLEVEVDTDQSRPTTGRWKATSSYDVYMVDTPKEAEGNGENNPVENKLAEKPPKRRRPKSRTKSHKGKDSNTITNDGDIPEQAEDPADPAMEQEEREDGEQSLKPLSDDSDAEDSNYEPVSKEDVSRGDDEYIIPEEPLEQKRFHRRLIATTRRLKK